MTWDKQIQSLLPVEIFHRKWASELVLKSSYGGNSDPNVFGFFDADTTSSAITSSLVIVGTISIFIGST